MDDMRVAFFGDMNNNFFSFMRHLRDLGLDAHLFLYKMQDTNQPRWAPTSDTYEWDKWAPYVHHTPMRCHWRELLGGRFGRLRKQLRDFDILFASGFAAALLARAGMRPDFFMPYSIGFEIIKNRPRRGLRYFSDTLLRSFQLKGVKSARRIVLMTGDYQTGQVARELGLPAREYTTIPMVYAPLTELPDTAIPDPTVDHVLSRLTCADFVVSSHVRHDWINYDGTYPGSFNIRYSKRTDILLRGFAKFVARSASACARLLLCDYGADVSHSKELIDQLGITSHVVWSPELKRRQIMRLIPRADVCAGEFMDACLTGGVVLESMAAGKPLLNALTISSDEYRRRSGSPIPPVIACNSVDDVVRNLLDLEANPSKRMRIGQAGRDWFDMFAGRGLAETFVRDFHELIQTKAR